MPPPPAFENSANTRPVSAVARIMSRLQPRTRCAVMRYIEHAFGTRSLSELSERQALEVVHVVYDMLHAPQSLPMSIF